MPERTGSSTGRSSLVLASASPRRRWLLEKLGIEFQVFPVNLDERARPGETPADFAQRMADEKAAAAVADCSDSWVLAADTVVALGESVLGKPSDRDDAVSMLTRLAGRTHTVYTAVALLRPGGELATHDVFSTKVTFRTLSAEEIRAYVATGEPFDRAGAYAIQGEGAHLVDRVEGSYTTVIGLPVPEVAEWLRAWRIG